MNSVIPILGSLLTSQLIALSMPTPNLWEDCNGILRCFNFIPASLFLLLDTVFKTIAFVLQRANSRCFNCFFLPAYFTSESFYKPYCACFYFVLMCIPIYVISIIQRWRSVLDRTDGYAQPVMHPCVVNRPS